MADKKYNTTTAVDPTSILSNPNIQSNNNTNVLINKDLTPAKQTNSFTKWGSFTNKMNNIWGSIKSGANKTWDAAKTSTNAQGQETLGGLNLINTGLNAVNMIGGMVLANNQLKLAKEQAARDEEQRQLENKRYDAQVARNKIGRAHV